MIRYLGEDYERSDDYANDQQAAQRRKEAGIQCSNCCFFPETQVCERLGYIVNEKSWCAQFEKRKAT